MKKLKFDIKIQVILLSATTGLILFLVNLFTISSVALNFLSAGIVFSGPLLIEYKNYKEKKEIEERFPDFLRDVTENIKTGMTLTQAIKATKDTYYGALTPHVRKMIVKIDWSIPFDKVLNDFSRGSTPLIKKTVSTIIETYSGGGDVTQILDSAGQTIKEINKVRKERSAGIYSQMVTGYITFFIFIGVLIILKNYLIPGLVAFGVGGLGTDFSSLQQTYSNTFQILILIEGLFSGLIIGKMAEGSMIAGLKHAFILLIIGYGSFALVL